MVSQRYMGYGEGKGTTKVFGKEHRTSAMHLRAIYGVFSKYSSTSYRFSVL
jgi:hypothetical protein